MDQISLIMYILSHIYSTDDKQHFKLVCELVCKDIS